jgi:hypothetical protein
MDDDEIGFDETASEETSSVPGVVTPLQKHADLIKWAKSKYLDVDPMMGAAEPIAKRMIRVLARRLISDGEYVSRRFQEGATAQELAWSVQETDSIAARLQALKGSL